MTSPARRVFLAYNTALGALTVHAAVRGEPGFAVIGALSLGWGALATTGVCLPWLEMYGRVVSRGPAGSARVALTFDDGPHPATTRRVLEALAPTRHRATFFVLGEKVRRHPASYARFMPAVTPSAYTAISTIGCTPSVCRGPYTTRSSGQQMRSKPQRARGPGSSALPSATRASRPYAARAVRVSRSSAGRRELTTASAGEVPKPSWSASAERSPTARS